MMKTLTDMVETTLVTDPETRNSDIALTTTIWKKYYKHLLLEHPKTGEFYVKLENLFELPREDNIKRIRAEIQNVERRYLPTNEEVFKERARLSKEWKAFLQFKSEVDFESKLHVYFVQKFGEVKKPRDMSWQAKKKEAEREELEKTQGKLI